MKRIHIIGGLGSGKTYLSRKLGKHFNIPVLALDDIYWDNTEWKQGIERPVKERDRQLEVFLQNENWVMEGIYYKWLTPSFEKADIIILIQPNEWLRNFRLFKRFIQSRLGLIDEKKQSFKAFIGLLKWAQKYAKDKIPPILEMTEPYKDKRLSFSSADEAFDFLLKQ